MYLHPFMINNSETLLYIDPGTGSLLAQAVLAGIIAGWVFFKNGIKRLFGIGKKKDTDSQ